MQSRSRYLIILVFIFAVIVAMFFMYSTISSPEKYTYYKGEPSSYERFVCILGGGWMEDTTDASNLPFECLSDVILDSDECSPSKTFTCHYR